MKQAYFCLGYIAAIATMNLAMWLGAKLRRNSEYYPEVPLTRDELAARREKLASSLINASYRNVQ